MSLYAVNHYTRLAGQAAAFASAQTRHENATLPDDDMIDEWMTYEDEQYAAEAAFLADANEAAIALADAVYKAPNTDLDVSQIDEFQIADGSITVAWLALLNSTKDADIVRAARRLRAHLVTERAP